MSAEMTTITAGSAPPAALPAGRVRPVLGVLADGTACYAPVGEVVTDGALVKCHLCGRSFRSVTAHLTSHGWTKRQYCEAFGLELGQSLESLRTRKLRSAAFTARLVFEPAVREGSAAGRARARSGDLTRQAAAAARGRRIPEQRRRKNALARAAIPAAQAARASRERADAFLAGVAARAAQARGYPDIGALVLARAAQGASLAAISREAGLHKDWLSRHLHRVDPVAAQAARRSLPDRADGGWLAVVRRLGFDDVAGYLRARHIDQHLTVAAIAAEVGMSPHAVESAMRRHGLDRTAHAAKRHAASERAAGVAAALGYATVADYVGDRRAGGWTWNAIAAESGQPQTWLRRHAAGRLEG